MTIHDPTAVPETDEQFDEYLHAADAAWDRNDHDHAATLYTAMVSTGTYSMSRAQDDSHALARLAEYHDQRGDVERAIGYGERSTEPAAAAIVARLRATTTERAVDPARPPETTEEFDNYMREMMAGFGPGGDRDRGYALALCLWNVGGRWRGMVALDWARALLQDHRPDTARDLLELALPLAHNDFHMREIRALLAQIGTESAADRAATATATATERQWTAAREAYEQGRIDEAKDGFLVFANDENATASYRAQACFFLGSLFRHQRHFDRAREYYQRAAQLGDGLVRTWANNALAEYWQEEQSGAYAGATR